MDVFRAASGTLGRAFYYSVMIEDQEFSPIPPVIDWLDYNGYTVITKPGKEFDDGEGRRRFKRKMHIEIAVDAMELAEKPGFLRCNAAPRPDDQTPI
jgi:uncharacterized LabA/DUF88 family protein